MSKKDLLRMKLNLAEQGVRLRVPRDPTPYEAERPRMPPIRLRKPWVALLARLGAPEAILDRLDRYYGVGDYDARWNAWKEEHALWESRRPMDEDEQVRRMEDAFRREEEEVAAELRNSAPRQEP